MRARPSPSIAALTLFISLSIASSLTARDAAAETSDAAAATALFQRAREAAKSGDYATAVKKLEESYRLDPAVGTLLNLADAHEHLGHLTTAARLFKRAVDALPVSDDRRPVVQKRITALEKRLPRLSVTLAAGAPPGAAVARDGAALEAGALGVEAPVDPGEHVIVVTAPGRQERRYPLTLGEARTERIVVDVGAPLVEVPGGPARASRSSKLRIAGYAVSGAAVLSAGAAVATGLMLPGKKKTVDAHCGEAVGLAPRGCDQAGYDAAQSGKTLAGINTAAWAVAGVALAAGVTLVIVGSVGGDKPAAALDLRVSPGFAGATMGGSF